MLHRSFSTVAVALTVLALAACGGGEEGEKRATTGAREPANEATVLVTRNCGKQVVVPKKSVPAGLNGLQALRRVADVEAAFGGKFVSAINGVEQNEKKKLAWLFYVNGKMAQKGAAEIKLEAGDVEWWDLHNWSRQCRVPPEAR